MSRRNNKQKSRKRNVISELIELYDIKSTEDIQDALKDLFGKKIKDMLTSEYRNIQITMTMKKT